MFNAYLFITGGEHHFKLAVNVSYDEAKAMCRTQLIYLPKVGRCGDAWLDAGGAPRLAVFEARTDPILIRERHEK